jgi:hypothetical protein
VNIKTTCTNTDKTFAEYSENDLDGVLLLLLSTVLDPSHLIIYLIILLLLY